MISVAEARARILAGVAPVGSEQVSIAEAGGRTLAADVVARVTQPPAPVSAMDGYAVRHADIAAVPATLRIVGTAPAGRPFAGTVGAGETVRIFTGASMPAGADTVVIQEDTEAQGEHVLIKAAEPLGRWVRRAGLDFKAGDAPLQAGRVLTPRDVGLCAAMNVPWLTVRRKPRVAILATGDEIVQPGEPIGPGQIVSSNSWALAAFVRANGGDPLVIGIAPDETATLKTMAELARGADLLVTSGGASVGDHDLVQSALGEIGLTLDFWKIAMRPGKPLMFGRFGVTPLLGLPGNPVSTMVCSLLFLGPLLAAFLGHGETAPRRLAARLGAALKANDRREDYLRATLARGKDGTLVATPFTAQDSSMMATLAQADGLILRAPEAPAAAVGDTVEVVPFADPGVAI
ncbi:MAG: molybdopterin molybdotransferase MoeA [Rhodospirillaceae bacterium]|nr:molybdopterin molybdotransferase MoeA [Rhodospirillaceae bacterium]